MARKRTTSSSRRRFSGGLAIALAGSASIPVTALIATLPRVASAANVKESAPHAKALRYASRSTKTGQSCSNCTLFESRGSSGAGRCPLFNGETVAAQAWCSAWVPRA
ncbi:MAG: high-potential iron-sulfur protein [Gammaproteobacteria bacterium]|nr:high-potential iron-sulfur protein [Gammaproteobacteria bacterium]